MTENMNSKKKIILIGFLFLWIYISRIYIIFRFGDQWTESDTGSWNFILQSFINSGTLIPNESTYVYPSGFGYQIISTFIVLISSITVKEYLILLNPFLGIIPFIIAYPFFLRYLKNQNAALLALGLLSLFSVLLAKSIQAGQSKFTFVLFLVILLLYQLFISDKKNANIYFSLIVICIIGFSTFNVFIGMLIACTFLFVSFVQKFFFNIEKSNLNLKPYWTIGVIFILSMFIFIYYTYPPANVGITLSRTIWDQSSQFLISGSEITAADSYNFIGTAYPNLITFYFLTVYQWVAIIFSIIAWIGILYYMRKNNKYNEMVILLIIYAFFSLSSVLAVISDVSGNSNLKNAQLRTYVFLEFIIPAIIAGFYSLQKGKVKKVISVILLLMIVIGIPTVLLKATMEPQLTNYWMYYSDSEQQSLKWSETYFHEYSVSNLGLRLFSAYSINADLVTVKREATTIPSNPEVFLISDIQIIQLKQAKLPYFFKTAAKNKIYNSQQVNIYHNEDSRNK